MNDTHIQVVKAPFKTGRNGNGVVKVPVVFFLKKAKSHGGSAALH